MSRIRAKIRPGSIEKYKDKIVIKAGGIELDLSPQGFHVYAVHYYQAYKDFLIHDKRSPVAYFLLCLTLELELKSRILWADEAIRPSSLKNLYSHDLSKLYFGLPGKDQVLSMRELETLKKASDLYGPQKGNKAFEYYQPIHALKGFSDYPDLNSLNLIVVKYLGTKHKITRAKKFLRLLGLFLLAIETKLLKPE